MSCENQSSSSENQSCLAKINHFLQKSIISCAKMNGFWRKSIKPGTTLPRNGRIFFSARIGNRKEYDEYDEYMSMMRMMRMMCMMRMMRMMRMGMMNMMSRMSGMSRMSRTGMRKISRVNFSLAEGNVAHRALRSETE
jgi:hypothetical protein